jgi:hypothetical protein
VWHNGFDMSEPIELEPFELDRETVARLGFNHGLKAMLIRLGIVLGTLILIFAFLALVTGDIEGWYATAYVTGLSIVAVSAIVWARWRNGRVASAHPLNRWMFSRRLVSFDDVEIRQVAGDNMRSFVPWSNFVQATLAEDMYLLWLTRSSYVALPRSAFKTAQDEESLRNILSARGLLKS